MRGLATDKQVRYALYLLSQAGYSTKYMNSEYKDFGATQRERTGRVESWLSGMDVARISELIDQVKKQLDKDKTEQTAA